MSTLATTVIPMVRQIVKTAEEADLTDDQILVYINQFYQYDVPAELQLFDLTTTYTFQTEAYVDKYNLPIELFNFYNAPFLVDGLPQAWIQSPTQWVAYSQPSRTQITLGTGDGSATAFTFDVYSVLNTPQASIQPFIRAHYTWNKQWTSGVVLTSRDANQNTMVVKDGISIPLGVSPPAQGQPSNANTGWLTENETSQCGTVNYVTGAITVQFSTPPAADEPIVGSFIFFQPGMPSAGFLYDNFIQLYPVPDRSYTIETVASKTPTAFLNSAESLQYLWMGEYLARGAAQKILSYVGDQTQYAFYQPLFKEQERYVLRRTSRQNATQRVYTPFANQVEPKIVAPYGAWRWF